MCNPLVELQGRLAVTPIAGIASYVSQKKASFRRDGKDAVAPIALWSSTAVEVCMNQLQYLLLVVAYVCTQRTVIEAL